ncbi:MAG: hypothetical protein IPK74_36340 [Deltaproteobacteria bacterium]|nr:hypothetical protein [Deltaproteobacteria bacterium]
MRATVLSFLVLGLGACSVSTSDAGGGDVDRGGIGKADLVGSCVTKKGKELCGGKGRGNCWCDELCLDFGDCCSDADEICGIEEPEPEGDACGGLQGLTCADDEFCAFAPEQNCGFADQLGECAPRPEACIALFDPVCGCDGQTYGNSCNAASAGVSVAHDGACEIFCGGFANLPCPEGMVCGDDPDDGCDPANGGADCGGICVPE